MPCNVLIAIRKPELAAQIRSFLLARGYTVTAVCESGMQALHTAAARPADIVIAGFTLPDMSGLDFSMSLLEKCDCSVLLLTPQEQIEWAREQAGALDIVTLAVPATAQAMLSSLELMQHYRARIRAASDEARRARSDLERRALAEKAKVALMHSMGMSEAEAWRCLQKRAMDTGRTLRSVAEQVLEQTRKGSQ